MQCHLANPESRAYSSWRIKADRPAGVVDFALLVWYPTAKQVKCGEAP
jgi:hypothetical protein